MLVRSLSTAVAALALTLSWVVVGSARADDLPTDACPPGAPSDVNGDGFTDAVVGDPTATVAGQPEAGRVVVLYGDADGRVGEGERVLLAQGVHPDEGRPEAPEVGDRFGSALSVADLDCDGFADVVVGSPYEDVVDGEGRTVVDAGIVQVVRGAAEGLGEGRATTSFDQRRFSGSLQAGSLFGYALDTREDWIDGATGAPDAYVLAVGAPGTDVDDEEGAGWVGVATAVDGGSTDFAITQATPGVPGRAEAGDRFGAALAIGQLRGALGTIDVGVGSPGEDVGAVRDAGAVTILTDVDDSPTGAAYDQSTAGVPGAVEAGDRFGSSLAEVRSGETSRLAVGVPGEDVGAARDAGMVQLFTSTRAAAGGSTFRAGAGLTQSTAGVQGVAERGDRFGQQITFAAGSAGSARARLVVGVPGEDTRAADAGVVQVLAADDPADDRIWAQDSPGVPGRVDAGDRFGASVAVVAGATETVLLVGVPDDVEHASGLVDVVPLSGGAGPRAWVPGENGVPAAAVRFGAVLTTAGTGGRA